MLFEISLSVVKLKFYAFCFSTNLKFLNTIRANKGNFYISRNYGYSLYVNS